jgi:hypothetical protein
VVDVEGKAYGDAAVCGVRQRARHEARGRLLEIEVVEGEVERPLRARDELADELGDLESALPPVG